MEVHLNSAHAPYQTKPNFHELAITQLFFNLGALIFFMEVHLHNASAPAYFKQNKTLLLLFYQIHATKISIT